MSKFLIKCWGLIITSISVIFFWIRYEIINTKKKQLEQDMIDSTKILNIQTKIIDVTQNTSPTDLNGTIKRMRNKKL
jgi:hypothetical protein